MFNVKHVKVPQLKRLMDRSIGLPIFRCRFQVIPLNRRMKVSI